MCPKASPSNLKKIGSEGFDLIDKHYGRFRRPQVPALEVPIIANSNKAGALFGDNKEKPKPPPRRNWAGRSLISLNSQQE